MTQTSSIDTEFSQLLGRLPEGFDLDASARAAGALVRRRAIRDGASLLRLAFAYSVGGFSLRGAAAWAALGEVAELSDVAVLNRLRGAADWLGEIVAAILSQRLPATAGCAGRSLRLVDATSLSCPGSRKSDWRLHVSYRLGAAPRVDAIDVSDGRGGESLGRFACGPGDVIIADRGYAKAGDLAEARAQGADLIVRTGWNALRLQDRAGQPFDLFALLASVPEGGTGEANVWIAVDRAGKQRLPMRLVVAALNAQDGEQARERARRKSRKQGKTVQQKTLTAAGYVLLLTSLDAASFAATLVCELYRLRWQIELLFKRLKSLLHLDQLPAKDPELARCWIYAKLIAALLLEDITDIFGDSPPWAEPHDAANRLDLAPSAAVV